MGKFYDKLTDQDKANIKQINADMIAKGITNDYTRASILAVAGKETCFKLIAEKNYSKTDNARIRKVFGLRLQKYSEAELTTLKKDPVAFFEAVYGSSTVVGRKNGNTMPGWGYRYRGRGFNQLTFYNSYKKIGNQIGVDLVNYPDKVNEFPIAIKVLIQYFVNCFNTAPKQTLNHYNTASINGFSTLDDAVKAVYHANAGFGKALDKIEADVTGGRKKALALAPEFLEIIRTKIN